MNWKGLLFINSQSQKRPLYMIISLTFCLAQIVEFCSLALNLNPTNAQKALLQCTLATELCCFFKVVLKEASITQRAVAVVL